MKLNHIFLFLLGSATLASSATRTWNGGHASQSNWNHQHNWGGANGTDRPANGDALIFAGSNKLANNNDYSGLSLIGITFSNTAGAFSISGNSLTLTAGGITNNSTSTQTLDAPLVLGGNSISINTASGNVLIGGAIGQTGGSRSLTKTGSQTLTLTNTNTYTGATNVNAGTLLVHGSGASLHAGSQVNVANGAKLGGHLGTVGSVSLANNAILAPGASVGSFTVAGLSGPATGAGILEIEYDYDHLGVGSHDFLAVAGELDLSNIMLSFSKLNTNFELGGTYVFASYGTLQGSQFAGVTGLEAYQFEIDYNFNDGNQIALKIGLTNIPEPSAMLLGGLGVLGLLRRRR